MRTPKEILHKFWGYPDFRLVQEKVIHSVLAKKDTLALMPTGGGKSLCYQVPAMMNDGLTIVISPLIALMIDQVRQLRGKGIEAVAIHSGLSYRDIDRHLDNCIYGNTKLLYLSPERLQTDLFRERARRMDIRLIAVDEAHCISEWGYDFRPQYLEIAQLRDELKEVPVLALTATATPEAVKDICEKLRFGAGHQIFRSGFERPNLEWHAEETEDKWHSLLQWLDRMEGSAIIYVRRRRRTNQISMFLERRGYTALAYHAGMSSRERETAQEAWLGNKKRIIVATNAFGMGIDKPDVRLVCHFDLPPSLESYYQEAGRAGRDGNDAFAVLLFHPSDEITAKKQLEISYPDREFIRQVYKAIGLQFRIATGSHPEESFPFELKEFATKYNLDPLSTYHALQRLQQSGWIYLSESFYKPPTIYIPADKQRIYAEMLESQRKEQLLKTLLRNYEGLFYAPVPVQPKQLVKLSGLDEIRIRELLESWNRSGLVQYTPSSGGVHLSFTRPRVRSSDLNADWRHILFLKSREQARLQAMLDYVESPACRSRTIREYFGDPVDADCGHCDRCLENAVDSKASIHDIAHEILQMLESGSHSLPAVYLALRLHPENRIYLAIEKLLEERRISVIGQEMKLRN